MNSRTWIRAISIAAVFFGLPYAGAQDAATAASVEPQAVADRIAREIAEIRGLSFKHPVSVQQQSAQQFGEYVSREIDEVVPESIRLHYGSIVRTLGLYRGPEIVDFSAMMKMVMTSQVGAYYDPDKQGFFVLMAGMPEMMQGVLYSHELYHALQDQHFGLARYLKTVSTRGADSYSADGHLARTAVVEGEATYMMSLWMIQKMTGQAPARDVMSRVVGCNPA